MHPIVALATPPGTSAIAVIRLSGEGVIDLVDSIFKGKRLAKQVSHSLHFGSVMAGDEVVDEVVVSLFRGPHSYNGEDTVEISSHGSPFVVQKIMQTCINAGARLAEPGEFTRRAFLHGKLDLSQAEAVADIIASENESQHRLAIKQMRGGYSDIIESLRQELIDFAALLELELDFSEEDVEFADRKKFLDLIQQMLTVIEQMICSFQLGNVIKQGIPIAIVGKPNVGKSTLLNALLREEKAIVSELAGTTRDFIEDTLQIHGIQYRFIDTAGIRETTDLLESKGIERSFEKIRQAEIILYMADIQESVDTIISDFQSFSFLPEQKVIILLNKSDIGDSNAQQSDSKEVVATLSGRRTLEISAREKRNMDTLISVIEAVSSEQTKRFDFIVSNARHLEAFQQAKASLLLVQKGLQEKMSGDFISIDVRTALYALGTITGKISSEDVLSSVFGRFCIGK